MDEFNLDFLDDEDDAQEKETMGGKEQTIILIDAQSSMLEPCTLEHDDVKGMSWLRAMVKVVAMMLRSKVVAGATDETALVFYNTRETKTEQGSLENVYVLQALDTPDVQRIHSLENFSMETFEQEIGSMAKDPVDGDASVRGLDHALWQAFIMLPQVHIARTGAALPPTLRIMLCTNDLQVDASLEESGLAFRAEQIAARRGFLELYPLVSSVPSFQLPPFWTALLDTANHRPQAGEEQAAAAPNAAQWGGEEEEEEGEDARVVHLEDLMSVVRARVYRKRALTRLHWQLAPPLASSREGGPPGGGAPVIGVRLYALLRLAWPASRGPAAQLDGKDNTLLQSDTAVLDAATGMVLQQSGKGGRRQEGGATQPSSSAPDSAGFAVAAVPRKFYPHAAGASPSCLFPKVYLSPEEERDLKFPLRKGMTLLGFKPMALLQPWHQLREPTFAYPDEGAVSGSTRAFVALHASMLNAKVFALCALVRSPAAEPRLVAAVPQVEELGPRGGQVAPPGLHLIHLPFADDLRAPESDPGFTGAERGAPREEAIAAAEALVAALSLGEDFDPGFVANPALQRHFEVLECIALRDDTMGVLPEARDETVPDAAAFEEAAGVIQAFKDSVYGPGYTADLQPKGIKRSAAAKDAPDMEMLQAQAGAVDFVGLAGSGKVGTLKIDQLKLYLRLHGLRLSGTKAELVARIEDHVKAAGKL